MLPERRNSNLVDDSKRLFGFCWGELEEVHCVLKSKAQRCSMFWGSGNSEKVSTSQVAMVIPLFFSLSVFIAKIYPFLFSVSYFGC